VREPPVFLTDVAVLATVRERWLPEADAVEHLPVGFGAWHWRAYVAGRPRLFLTVDRLGGRHTSESLEAAYRGATHLAAAGLGFVLAPSPTLDGSITAPVGEDRLSATPWLDATSGDGTLRDDAEARQTAEMLRRLHATPPPPGLPRWAPLVDAELPARLAERVRRRWVSGPYAEQARAALTGRLRDLERWVKRYLDLAAWSDPSQWVATHGEPHTRNQLRTDDGRTVLVDWESLKFGPRERDLRVLVDHGYGALCEHDADLVAMFDLEWRLDEIAQYADWFEAPHAGTDSDRVAIGGLLHELERPG
jgi:spectinomycin phosphotransferase